MQETNPIMQNPSSKFCYACKGECDDFSKCQRFLELAYNARWSIVKDSGACRKCLKLHRGPCKSEQLCGQNGCVFKHHPLLHNPQRVSATPAKEQNLPSTSSGPSIQNLDGRDCNAHYNPVSKTLFRVVPVVLYGRSKALKTYAF